MKLWLILSAVLHLALIAYAEEANAVDNSLNGILKECMEETGAPESFISSFIQGEIDFEDDKGKCFVKCFCQKMGFCDENLMVANMDSWIVGKNGITKEKVG